MIWLTRINGEGFLVNPDYIVRADNNDPHTLVTMQNGAAFYVSQSLILVQQLVQQARR